VAESAPVPNADPTPAETMLMNQTVEQYMASLVSKLHLDADPSGLAHTLESELGITSMEELQDAAEQLPYVLDDSFPREILEELVSQTPQYASSGAAAGRIEHGPATEYVGSDPILGGGQSGG